MTDRSSSRIRPPLRSRNVVAEREHGAGDGVEEHGRRLIAIRVAPRDVARADEHRFA
jgi:hypothetical protein